MLSKINSKYIELDYIALHKEIKDSGKLNFQDLQFTVTSQLHRDRCEHLLKDYWDIQIPLLIRYGFLLDFNKKSPLQSKSKNHASAKKFPWDIQAYLCEEIKYNAILGLFHTLPIPNLHTSPFLTREKANSKHRRFKVDLSFPLGNSINSGVTKDKYLGTPYQLTLQCWTLF